MSALKDNLIYFLNQLIDTELAKPPEQINCEFVDECLDFLEYAMAKDNIDLDEINASGITKLLKTNETKDAFSSFFNKSNVVLMPQKLKKKKHIKKAAVIAVCVFCLVIGSIIGTSGKIGGFLSDIFEAIRYSDMSSGENTYVSDYNVFKYDGVEKYSSFEEFIDKNNAHLKYPKGLGSELMVISVIALVSDGKISLNATFSGGAMLYIELYSDKTESVKGGSELIVNGINCIEIEIDGMYHAYFSMDSHSYVLQAPSYDIMIEILNSF